MSSRSWCQVLPSLPRVSAHSSSSSAGQGLLLLSATEHCSAKQLISALLLLKWTLPTAPRLSGWNELSRKFCFSYRKNASVTDSTFCLGLFITSLCFISLIKAICTVRRNFFSPLLVVAFPIPLAVLMGSAVSWHGYPVSLPQNHCAVIMKYLEYL